jgi:hypothetical protein
VDLVVNSRRRLLCRRLAHLSLFSFALRTALSNVVRVTTRATVPFGNRTEAIAGAEAGRLMTMPTDLFAEFAKATPFPPRSRANTRHDAGCQLTGVTRQGHGDTPSGDNNSLFQTFSWLKAKRVLRGPDLKKNCPAKNAIAASALSNTLTGSTSPTARALGGGNVQPDSRSGHPEGFALRNSFIPAMSRVCCWFRSLNMPGWRFR